MPAETRLFLCRSDNYGVLLHDQDSGATAAIDAPEAAPDRSGAEGDRLETDGHPGDASSCRPYRRHHALKGKYKCRVVAPAAEAATIPAVDETVREGDRSKSESFRPT